MQVKEKILIVDDDPNNITILKELLVEKYDLKTATTGEQALEITQNFQPDIILLDIMMPGMDGYETCRQLREHCKLKHTKIIIVSARAMASEQLEGYKAGADDYITKPFDVDEFLLKLSIYLRLKHSEEMDQMKYEFATTTIHKLRTPAVVIKNILSDAIANIFGEISPTLRHQLEIANESVDSLERVISNFSDISEIYSGIAELQLSRFSMQSLVWEVVNKLKQKVTLKKIFLNTDTPTEELFINADRQKIAKVLGNLIDNTIEITHEGDSIYVRVRYFQDRIVVDVECKGPGIKTDKIDEFLTRFAQIEKHIGICGHNIGFGLAIAKGLVELHSGRIWAENRPEGGVVFSFEIPITTETKKTTQSALSSAGVDSGECELPEMAHTNSKPKT